MQISHSCRYQSSLTGKIDSKLNWRFSVFPVAGIQNKYDQAATNDLMHLHLDREWQAMIEILLSQQNSVWKWGQRRKGVEL